MEEVRDREDFEWLIKVVTVDGTLDGKLSANKPTTEFLKKELNVDSLESILVFGYEIDEMPEIKEKEYRTPVSFKIAS